MTTWSLISVSDCYYLRSSVGASVVISFDLNTLVHKRSNGAISKHIGPKARKASINILRQVGVDMAPQQRTVMATEDISQTYYTDRVLVTPAPAPAPKAERVIITPPPARVIVTPAPARVIVTPPPAPVVRWEQISFRTIRFQSETGSVATFSHDFTRVVIVRPNGVRVELTGDRAIEFANSIR